MNQSSSSVYPPPFSSLLFHFKEIALIGEPTDELLSRPSSYHCLLMFISGTGMVDIGPEQYLFHTGHGYWLAPGESYQIAPLNGTVPEYYKITFEVIALTSEPQADMALAEHAARMPSIYHGAVLPEPREYIVSSSSSKLIQLIEELFYSTQQTVQPHNQTSVLRQQIMFQELLLLWQEDHTDIDQNNTSNPALPASVEGTLSYMENNYEKPITVKQLAEQANVSIWQYSQMFRKITGKKPLHYLTELRLNHAKRLLLDCKRPLREIARQVGFSDEYYFNRRFRQMTGIPPGKYALSVSGSVRVKDWTGHHIHIPRRASRIIYHGETMGDLLALGAKAIGGSLQLSEYSVYKHRLVNVADVGLPLDTRLTSALDPDLIIIANSDEQEYKRIASIAPTVTFNSFATLEERMRTLGAWLGKEREAERWLSTFKARNLAMWQQLGTQITAGETASVFIFDHGDRLFVMGMSGFSSALYHPQGFQPVEPIQKVLDEGHGFAEIDPNELPDYAGDRIFMLVPTAPESKRTLERMISSPLWRSLPAVRQGRVYFVEADRWNWSDAMTRQKLLTALPKLLVTST
ncbi:ABC-type Fe3+-hydroxamate transport system substrate-binding protein [Paenibacillus sp. 1182]|uniref:ABC transporter substrate-binding protein n=1 Tax=Paenibacillus sp. 1182 TaxID=2806565 RepID=UPI000FAB683E|nr:ABC transporter substrate-binding protein [Paenibacillus sp. 1182]MBP1310161.1 ABC-type Fe3+-hydroxamate transport system substrate-binding protein [Paenibacillus sp. 1182]